MDEKVTIEVDKIQSRLVLQLLEANASVRPTFFELLKKMREKGWC
jgi:hypothetical protein